MTNTKEPNVLVGKELITIALPRKLSERQRFLVKKLGQDFDLDGIRRFLRSFQGNRYAYGSEASRRLRSDGALDTLSTKKAGSVLDLYKRKHDVFASGNLSPSKAIEDGKAIGIEIECFVPMSIEELKEAFLKNRIPNVRAAEDGSIRPEDGYSDVEFRVLSDVDDLSNLRELCAFLSKIGARVNKSCGLHVHLDARGFERCPVSIVKRLRAALPLLSAMVPQSRLDNQYCSRDVSARGSRYAKINRESFSRHKTIEVRLHSGTCDFVKISSWIAILHSIAFSRKKIDKCDVMTYAAKLSWPATLIAYVIERSRKFNPSFIGESQEPSSTMRDEENREIPEERFECGDCGCEISESESEDIGRCYSCDEEECRRHVEEEEEEQERREEEEEEQERRAEARRLERARIADVELARMNSAPIPESERNLAGNQASEENREIPF